MKIRKLKSSLSKAGFIRLKKRGKGSHSVWRHPTNHINIVCSGKDSKDAKPYQLKAFQVAIAKTDLIV